MLGRKSPQDVLNSYKKRRNVLPVVIMILAISLVVIGIAFIIMWLTGGGLSFNLFSREPTPTSTMPPTPVLSPTPSIPPTETPEPTSEATQTPTGPFEYEVQEFDNCYDIAAQFEVDFQTLLAINNFPDGTCPIIPGQLIKVPASGQTLPTPTPLPADTEPGTRIEYSVQSGDTLASIASQFNSTQEDILAQNGDKIEDENNLPVGLVLTIRVYIVTPTPTFAPTSTLAS
jgi:LysM repeat protein